MADERTILAGKIAITPLLNASNALREAIAQAETQLEHDGALQRFEFTYELLWKTLKKILAFKGINVNNPRDVFREAARNQLIDNPKFWFEVIRKRNLTTHVYNQQMADAIFDFLQQFEPELTKVLKNIEQL